MSGFRFKDWGRLSKEIILFKGCDFSTGEIVSIIDAMWERLASRIVCAKCGNNAHWWILGWICENCGWKLIRRQDDSNMEAVKTRLEAFHRDTEPALNRVEEQWRLVHIDANRWVDEIFEDVLKYVNN